MPRKVIKKVWYADFETTKPNKYNQSFVYYWAMVCGDEIKEGNNIESFINTIKNMKKAEIYFHNLSGFDFEFIEYYLLSNNIEYKWLDKKQRFYSVDVFKVKLFDSMNWLNMSLQEIGENYCIKYKKSRIDHIAEEGHIATEEEKQYCINDCFVLQEGMINFKNELIKIFIEQNMFTTAKAVNKKLTISSLSYIGFRELSNIDKSCPKTTIDEYWKYKNAYKGGYVYSNPIGIQKNVKFRDVNSIYPKVYRDYDLPIGKGIICNTFNEIEKYKFYIAKIRIKYELKPDGFPIIGSGFSKFGSINYKSSSNGEWEERTECNIDLDLIKENYYCEIELINGWGFKTQKGLFFKYCDLFMNIKKNSKGVRRNIAKLMLNSPYGVLAKNGLLEKSNRFIDQNGIIRKELLITEEINENMFEYLPMAICITAGARQILLTAARKIGKKNVFYMDTDSIKFNGEIDDLNLLYLDDYELGAFKIENKGKNNYFKTIAAKRYVYWEEDIKILEFTCAGFNKKSLEKEMQHNCYVTEEQAIERMLAFDKGLNIEVIQAKKVLNGKAIIDAYKRIK